MRSNLILIAALNLVTCLGGPAHAERPPEPTPTPRTAPEPAKTLVDRLDLERYKATIKGLTQFGDRRQGTDRNKAAIDWIEAQLKSYGCSNTERIAYSYEPPASRPSPRPGVAAGGPTTAAGGGRPRGVRAPTGVNTDPMAQPDLTLRQLNAQPSTPGRRDEVYCTKIGTTHPDEMYIVGAH